MSGPWTMKIGFDPYFLQWLGRKFGNDEEEYLVCSECDERYPWVSDLPACRICGGELHVHVPDSELMVIRWRCWKGQQKWWPQKYYVWPSKHERDDLSPYHYWAFWGHEWFKREDPRPDWWDNEEEE